MKSTLPEELYVHALIQELTTQLEWVHDRAIKSIFFGGGTPSLFNAHSIASILQAIDKHVHLPSNIEITLEANPGTIDQTRFTGLHAAGINRLSLGIQSLQNDKLATLGRIHDSTQAMQAIRFAKQAGFTNFNLDLMYGLPHQTLSDALEDIRTALEFEPTHLSWYQLTIEPNTLFYRQKPPLPADDTIWEMQLAGQDLLKNQGYQQYEVSAYAQPHRECAHNRNYWEFGDYLGLGAGAHSKITHHSTGQVWRWSQVKHPKDYLDVNKRLAFNRHAVEEKDLVFEFMLNALRLTQGVPYTLFPEHTGIPLLHIEPKLAAAKARGLMLDEANRLCPTEHGMKFLNDLVAMFL